MEKAPRPPRSPSRGRRAVPVSAPTAEEIASVERRGSERAAAAARRARTGAEAEVRAVEAGLAGSSVGVAITSQCTADALVQMATHGSTRIPCCTAP